MPAGVPALRPSGHGEAPAVGRLSGQESAAEPGLSGGWLEDPRTLLLVEDDAGDYVLVEELLADSGMHATLVWVQSLAEAKEILRRDGSPDCALLDLHLSDAHGLEVVSALLAAAPGVPVVVLTGLAEENAGLAAVAAGAQDYLIKGQAAPDVFSRAIRYAAQRKHVEQASAALQISAVRAEENARLERGLLPTPLLRTSQFEAVARYRPGNQQSLLGGDFYDVVETADGTVHAVIGDVAGHGPAEAATGVCLRVAWRSLILAGTAAPDLIELLEQMLVAEREGDRVFATLTCLAFPPGRGQVRVLRAGHPGLLLRTAGRIELVEGKAGPALGLMPGLHWQEEELPLPPGASVVLFTDGLFECRTGPGSERLGEDGLLAVAQDLAALPAGPFTDRLIERIEAAAAPYGGLADDVAVVHLGWRRGE
ncbi:MAG TPA: SpoIIE family protein phosphatase [Streptosporangiaceae bacterium]|nr:SpoIIE family protein phosphatase [Streptosporangiaceae bacterium]